MNSDHVVVARPAVDLCQIANQINVEHEAASVAFQSALERARMCGELLSKAKKLCGHGVWLPWLEKNCPRIGPRQAQKYMRLATKWVELQLPNANPDSHLTIDKALSQLVESETPEEVVPTPSPLPAEVLASLRDGRSMAAVRLTGDESPGFVTVVELVPSVEHPGYTYYRVIINEGNSGGEEIIVRRPARNDWLVSGLLHIAGVRHFAGLSWFESETTGEGGNPWIDSAALPGQQWRQQPGE